MKRDRERVEDEERVKVRREGGKNWERGNGRRLKREGIEEG